MHELTSSLLVGLLATVGVFFEVDKCLNDLTVLLIHFLARTDVIDKLFSGYRATTSAQKWKQLLRCRSCSVGHRICIHHARHAVAIWNLAAHHWSLLII